MRSSDVVAGVSFAAANQYNYLRDDAKGASYLLAHEKDTPDMQVAVESGEFYISTVKVTYAGGNSATFTAPTVNPRIDNLSINSSGVLVITAGSEDATPENTKGETPAGNIGICEIYFRVGATTILDEDDSSNAYIQEDMRPFLQYVLASDELVKVGAGGTADYLNSTYFQQDGGNHIRPATPLVEIVDLSPSNDDIIQRKAGVWANRTLVQYKTDLSLNLVENTALSTWAGSANITALGTLASGNVNAAVSVLADGVTATTQTPGDDSTKVATTEYVDAFGVLSTPATAGENVTAGNILRWGNIFANPVLEASQTTKDTNDSIYAASATEWVAQTFTTSADAVSIQKVALDLFRSGSADKYVGVSIRATSANLPTGSDLAFAAYEVDDIPTGTGGTTIEFEFNFPCDPSTVYAIVVTYHVGNNSNKVNWKKNSAAGYAGGRRCYGTNGSSWTGDDTADMVFRVYEGQEDTTYVYKADSSEDEEAQFAGIAQTTESLGATVNIKSSGIDNSQSGLTPGVMYYLSTAGGISSSVGTNVLQIGKALSATEIDINVQHPLVAGDNTIMTQFNFPYSNSTTYGKQYEARIERAGTYRIDFTLLNPWTAGTSYARIYKNGAAVGTERGITSATDDFTQDLFFAEGDLLQIYTKVSATGSNNFSGLQAVSVNTGGVATAVITKAQ